MAIYHFHSQIISRADGREATAAAAYRAAEKIESEYSGIIHDYSRKGFVVYSNILLPENAPKEFKNREKLWQSVERSEKRSDAQLAREVEVALPKELMLMEQVQLIEKFVRENFVCEGMCADICLHNPPLRDGNSRPVDVEGRPTHDPARMIYQNPHAHIMLTMRPLNENGKWMPKTQAEYLCIKNGQEKGFTAQEFCRYAQKEGWEKQYPVYIGGKKAWLTDAEIEQRNLQKISDKAKTSRYGRQDPQMQNWNSPQSLLAWRKSWEVAVNEALERAGVAERITAESYESLGSLQIPQIHAGPQATAMAKKDFYVGAVERVNLNKLLKDLNTENLLLRKEIARLENHKMKLMKEIKATASSEEQKGLLKKLIMAEYWMKELAKKQEHLSHEISAGRQVIDACKRLSDSVDAENAVSQARIKSLEGEEEKLGILQFGRREEIRDAISEERQKIDFRKEHLRKMLDAYGLKSATAIVSLEFKVKALEDELSSVEQQIVDYKSIINSAMEKYSAATTLAENSTSEKIREELDRSQERARNKIDRERGTVDDQIFRSAVAGVTRRIVRQRPQRLHVGGAISGIVNAAVNAVEAVEEQQEQQNTRGRGR